MILIFLKTPLQKNEEREEHCDQSAAELPFLSFETHVITSVGKQSHSLFQNINFPQASRKRAHTVGRVSRRN